MKNHHPFRLLVPLVPQDGVHGFGQKHRGDADGGLGAGPQQQGAAGADGPSNVVAVFGCPWKVSKCPQKDGKDGTIMEHQRFKVVTLQNSIGTSYEIMIFEIERIY